MINNYQRHRIICEYLLDIKVKSMTFVNLKKIFEYLLKVNRKCTYKELSKIIDKDITTVYRNVRRGVLAAPPEILQQIGCSNNPTNKEFLRKSVEKLRKDIENAYNID